MPVSFFSKWKMVWICLLMGMVLYGLDALVHTHGIGERTILERILLPEGIEIWTRSVILFVCLLFGFTAQYIIDRQLRAQQHLLESEESLRATLASMEDLLFVLDKDGVFLEYRAPLDEMLLVPPEQFLGRSYRDVMPPPVVEKIDEAMVRVRTNNEYSQTDYSLELNGQTLWFNARFSPRRESDGRVDGVTVVVRDISVQKRAELALRDSENRFRSLVDATLEGVMFHNEGVILDANIQFARLFGYDSPAELIGRNGIDLLLTPASRTVIRECMSNGRGTEAIEVTGVRKDGSTFLGETQSSVSAYLGTTVRVVSMRDITKRKKSEEALRESEQRFRNLIENQGEGVGIADLNEVFTFTNPAADKIFGVEKGCLIGRCLREFLNEEQRTLLQEESIKRSEGKSSAYELEIIREDGQHRSILVTASPQFDKNSKREGSFGVFRDITERKQMEVALRSREEALRESQAVAGLGSYVLDIHANQWTSSQVLDGIFGIDDRFDRTTSGWLSILHPEWREIMGEYFQKEVIDKRERFDKQYKIIRKSDGEERWVHGLGRLEFDAQGQPVRMLGTIQDITLRQQAEEALHTSEALLKSTLESTGDGILVVDNTGKVINANKRFAELWRIPQSLLDERDDHKLLDFALAQLVEPQLFVSKVMLLYLSAEEDFDTLLFKDGRVFDRFSCPLMLNDKIMGRVWSFRDVTEQRRAEQELRLTRFSIDRSGDAVYWINSEGAVVDANETACKALGYTRDELISLAVWDITGGVTKEEWLKQWQHVKSKKCFVLESNRKRKDGSVVPTEVSINYIEFEGQEFICSFTRDISDRKRNETVQSVLYEISEATGRSSTLLELLEIMQQQIGRLMDTENFYIALYDDVTDLYSFAFVRDKESVDPKTIPPQKLRRSLTDYVRRMGAALLLTNYDQQALIDAGEVDLLGTQSKLWMGIPLTLSDRVIGVVGIQSYTDDTLYTERDKELMSIIASSIAMAIERKRSEEFISRLRGAVESSGEVIFMTDHQGVYTYVNPEFTRLYGYAAVEVIGKQTPRVLKSDKHTLQEYERLWSVLQHGQITRSEMINVTKDGKLVTVAVSVSPIYNEKNEIGGFLAVQRDVTLQKQAELELRDNESKLAEAQHIAKVGSWEHWIETGRMKASDELHRIFGLDPVRDKVTKAGVFPQMFHPEDKARAVSASAAAIRNKTPLDIDFRIVLPDGTIKHIHEHAQFKIDSEGHEVVFGTAQDITEQKKAEEERKSLETQLRRTQRLETIGTLAGGIAHDFNNILTPILGYADMAIISMPEEHPVRDDLEHVIKAAHRAKELVQQILTFSRQGDQEKMPLEIHLIVKEVLELLRASLPSSIEIKQNVDTTCGRVLADPSQIHQVLMNLCTNAFHAMRDSGGTLEVSLGVDAEFTRVHPSMVEQPYIKLAVRDTGSGMSKSIMDRIFEPFFTTKSVGEGTGLGLSVAHGIITNHGGDIIVESEPGKGTTFNVYLPQAQHLPCEAPTTPNSAAGGNEHILLVDDEEEITIMAKRMLEKLGYRITTRNSSVDALKLFSANPHEFDMVICDQTMPQLAGSELTSELLAIRPDLPVLMMTGYSELFSSDDARRLGIRQYLTKPLVAGDLDAAIRKQLGNPNLSEI